MNDTVEAFSIGGAFLGLAAYLVLAIIVIMAFS